jgi:myo-inositol-1(or 4)-monophosphatase
MIEIAKKAALSAAKILMDNFGTLKTSDVREKNRNDFLTFVDEISEKEIITVIKTHYPDHTILAEESGFSGQNAQYRWIIDPLDGTKNYICNIPIFSVSIALQYQGKTILGVVYDPVHNELFTAEKGKGALLNGNPIKVNSQDNPGASLFGTGFPFKYKPYLSKYLDCFEDIFFHLSGVRRMGSAAIDLCYVASGRFEGFWEIGLSAWDMAAGSLIIEEAGGYVTDFWADTAYLENSFILATNGYLHDHILKIIQKHFPKPIKLKL